MRSQHDRSDPRIIRALVSTGAGLEPDPSAGLDDTSRTTGFISPNDILEQRTLDAPDAIAEPVQPVTIHIGFTGVVFKDREGKEKREVFSILMVISLFLHTRLFFSRIILLLLSPLLTLKRVWMYPGSWKVPGYFSSYPGHLASSGPDFKTVFKTQVTPADNFALIQYIHDKFLMKPKIGCQKYEQLMELYLEANMFFRQIMRYECFCNLGADEQRVGLPEDYKEEPGGKLGMATVLSQFQIPIKIFNVIKNEHAGADLSSIRIIGCPEMTFQHSDDFTRDWIEYMHKSIREEAQRQRNLLSGIDRYCATKDKAEFAAITIEMSGGWPLETDDSSGVVRAFGYPPLPLMHRFDANGARGSFSVFIASIGDADQALPDLTRAILTAFLVHSSDIHERPEIDHLLKDKRKANPLLVSRPDTREEGRGPA
jgi:hypothetical protein